MRRFYLLAFCLFLITMVGCDDFSKDALVVGTVIHEITRKPVSGVNIVMGSQVTVSDRNGRFAFVGNVENADVVPTRPGWQFEQEISKVDKRSVYQITATPPKFDLNESQAIKLGYFSLNMADWFTEKVYFDGLYVINKDIISFNLYRWSESNKTWEWINYATIAEAFKTSVMECKMCDSVTADAAQYVIVANTAKEIGVFSTPIMSYRVQAEMAPGIEPKGNIGNHQPKFKWDPSYGYEKYRIEVKGATLKTNIPLVQDTEISKYLEIGKWEWRYFGLTYPDKYTLLYARSGITSFSIY